LNNSSSCTARGLLTIPTDLAGLPREVSKANDENMPGYKDVIASLTARQIPVQSAAAGSSRLRFTELTKKYTWRLLESEFLPGVHGTNLIFPRIFTGEVVVLHCADIRFSNREMC